MARQNSRATLYQCPLLFQVLCDSRSEKDERIATSTSADSVQMRRCASYLDASRSGLFHLREACLRRDVETSREIGKQEREGQAFGAVQLEGTYPVSSEDQQGKKSGANKARRTQFHLSESGFVDPLCGEMVERDALRVEV